MDLAPELVAARERVIVALDVPTLAAALDAVRELTGHVGAFKVGLELLTAEGSGPVVRAVHQAGGRVFYDAKFCDIPNTVAGAARGAAGLGVWAFDVHASCGRASMAAAAREKGDSLLLAVTVLTSLDDAACREVFGDGPEARVLAFARAAAESGADGVVCSPCELVALRADPALAGLRTVVPGVRPAWAATGDQARVATPGDAIRAGASWLVIGRPILSPPDGIGGPAAAADRIAREIAEALR